MQVDLVKPTLKGPGSKRLKLEHEKTLPGFGFKINLRRYSKEARRYTQETADDRAQRRTNRFQRTFKAVAYTRPLFSST